MIEHADTVFPFDDSALMKTSDRIFDRERSVQDMACKSFLDFTDFL